MAFFRSILSAFLQKGNRVKFVANNATKFEDLASNARGAQLIKKSAIAAVPTGVLMYVYYYSSLAEKNGVSNLKEQGDSELRFKFRLISPFGHAMWINKKFDKPNYFVVHFLLTTPSLPSSQKTEAFDERLMPEIERKIFNYIWIDLKVPRKMVPVVKQQFNKHGCRQMVLSQPEYTRAVIMLYLRYNMPAFFKELDEKHKFERRIAYNQRWMIVDSQLLEKALEEKFVGHVEVIPVRDKHTGIAFIRELQFMLDEKLKPKVEVGRFRTHGVQPSYYYIAEDQDVPPELKLLLSKYRQSLGFDIS